MKKVIIMIAFVVVATTAIAQPVFDTLKMADMVNVEWIKQVPNATNFRTIEFRDSTVFSVGEAMKLGRPSAIGLPVFSYIMLGRMGNMMLTGRPVYLPEQYKGRDVVIENIRFYKGGKKATTGTVLIIFNNPGLDITVFDVDAAMYWGELINPKKK